MRLGISGLLPRGLEAITPEALRQVRAAGFSGVALTLTRPPAEVGDDEARAAGRLLRNEGVDAVELGQYQTTLIDPDPAVRRRNVADLRQALRVARAVGGGAVITGSGSLNPKSQWFAHPDNHGPAARARLIDALGEAGAAAAEAGVVLALECHTNTALTDAPTTRAILDAVGSPWLKVHLDAVNWITPATIFATGAAIDAMVDALGAERISGAHAKGVALEDRLIVHLNETDAGAPDDRLDYHTYLRRLGQLAPDTYLVIEHTPPERIPAARDFIRRVAAEVGVAIRDA